ncbi:hypothetical protein [Priestia megaterium]|uniref:hypothetical protein n=1 Tax=Priestia megaterium TaxID=1404 RepID=UPI00406BC476
MEVKCCWIKLMLIIMSIFIITACENPPISQRTLDIKNNKNLIIKREFTTNDKKTKFIIINEDQLDNKYINQVTSETQEVYSELSSIYKNENYDWDKEIKIYLRMGNGISVGTKNSIVLYNVIGGNYLLAHELTHTMLGFGELSSSNFNEKNGYFTQEGMAVYLQEKLSPNKKIFPTNSLEIHSLMKFIYENGREIPLKQLTSNTVSHDYFNSNDKTIANRLLWESYIEAGSFVEFLIDKYGIENFLKVYNSPNIQVALNKVYKKSLDDLENDWLSFIKNEVEYPNSDQKSSILFP